MGHHEIRVALNGSVTLGLTCNGNRLLGVGRVDVGGVALRDPSRPIRPLITTPDVYTYDEFRVLAVKKVGKRVIVKTQAVGRRNPRMDEGADHLWNRTIVTKALPETVEDELDWIFEPRTETVDGPDLALTLAKKPVRVEAGARSTFS